MSTNKQWKICGYRVNRNGIDDLNNLPDISPSILENNGGHYITLSNEQEIEKQLESG